jgi:hypothetical protein
MYSCKDEPTLNTTNTNSELSVLLTC